METALIRWRVCVYCRNFPKSLNLSLIPSKSCTFKFYIQLLHLVLSSYFGTSTFKFQYIYTHSASQSMCPLHSCSHIALLCVRPPKWLAHVGQDMRWALRRDVQTTTPLSRPFMLAMSQSSLFIIVVLFLFFIYSPPPHLTVVLDLTLSRSHSTPPQHSLSPRACKLMLSLSISSHLVPHSPSLPHFPRQWQGCHCNTVGHDMAQWQCKCGTALIMHLTQAGVGQQDEHVARYVATWVEWICAVWQR